MDIDKKSLSITPHPEISKILANMQDDSSYETLDSYGSCEPDNHSSKDLSNILDLPDHIHSINMDTQKHLTETMIHRNDTIENIILMDEEEKISLLRSLVGSKIDNLEFESEEYLLTYIDVYVDDIRTPKDIGDGEEKNRETSIYVVPRQINDEGIIGNNSESIEYELYVDEIKEFKVNNKNYKFL